MLALLATVLLCAQGGGSATIIQGTVETKVAEGEFVPLKAGAALPPGTWIRTGAASKALLALPGNVELRINRETEVLFEDPRKLTLKSGEIFLKVPKGGSKFVVMTTEHPIETEFVVLDLDYKPRIPNGAPATTTIMVLDGKVQAFSKKYAPYIMAGWCGVAFGTQLNTPDAIGNSAIDTMWVHSLLVERGKTDDETAMRTSELLEVLAKKPDPDPAETALRSLGELAVPGLARWLPRSVQEPQVRRRAVAAQALIDAATLKSAPVLAGLLTHHEAQVRVLIAKGLEKLAGKDLGFKEDYWKGEKLEAGQKAWEDWVKQNVK